MNKVQVWLDRIIYILFFVCFGWLLSNNTSHYLHQREIRKIINDHVGKMK